MKPRNERLEVASGKSVEMLGVSFSDERKGAQALRSFISEVAPMLDGKWYYTLLPSGIVKDIPIAFVKEGLSFARWSQEVSSEVLLNRDVEEPLILFIPENQNFERAGIRHGNSDPYFWAKALPANGECVSMFFSAWHKDLEIFLPPQLNMVFTEMVMKQFSCAG